MSFAPSFAPNATQALRLSVYHYDAAVALRAPTDEASLTRNMDRFLAGCPILDPTVVGTKLRDAKIDIAGNPGIAAIFEARWVHLATLRAGHAAPLTGRATAPAGAAAGAPGGAGRGAAAAPPIAEPPANATRAERLAWYWRAWGRLPAWERCTWQNCRWENVPPLRALPVVAEIVEAVGG